MLGLFHCLLIDASAKAQERSFPATIWTGSLADYHGHSSSGRNNPCGEGGPDPPWAAQDLCGAQHVASQYTQSTAIGWDIGVDRHIH